MKNGTYHQQPGKAMAARRVAQWQQPWLRSRNFLLVLIMATLTACGGGGSDDSSNASAGDGAGNGGSSSDTNGDSGADDGTGTGDGADNDDDNDSGDSGDDAGGSGDDAGDSGDDAGDSGDDDTAEGGDAPVGLQLTSGPHQFTATWNEAAEAESFNLYYAEDPDLVPENYAAYEGAHLIQDVDSPYTVSGLEHDHTYYVIVIAVAGDEEGGASDTVAVTLPLTDSQASGAVNDTGIAVCADIDTHGLSCPVADYPRQDAESGRDAAALAGELVKTGAGDAGFDFSKISNGGAILTADAQRGPDMADWACTLDQVTGLTWEVKTDDAMDLRYYGHQYRWYSTDADTNGGDPGVPGPDGGPCTGVQCDTQSYISAVNAAGLCGHNDWRLPRADELLSLVHFAQLEPAIDSDYFPNVGSGANSYYHTATTVAGDTGNVWFVNFEDGGIHAVSKASVFHLRLVRSRE